MERITPLTADNDDLFRFVHLGNLELFLTAERSVDHADGEYISVYEENNFYTNPELIKVSMSWYVNN